MNTNTKWYILVAFMFFLPSILKAKIGCMDNSWHLQKKYDNKEYHYVSCTCPCRDTVMHRNQCLYCQHYHDSKPWTVIQGETKSPNKGTGKLQFRLQNAMIAMRKLVEQYKKEKQ